MSCHPGGCDAVLLCPAHQSCAVVVQTSAGQGTLTLRAAVEPPSHPPPPGGAMAWMSLLFAAVAVMLVVVPDSTALALDRASKYFFSWLRFAGVAEEAVDAWTVCAYFIARCAPPVGVPRPEFMTRVVRPATAAQDLTSMRRWARMRDRPELLSALCSERVIALGHSLGAHVKRTRSEKKPILISMVRFLILAGPQRSRDGRLLTPSFHRNVALILIGLLAGLRRSEIASLEWRDVQWNPAAEELTIVIRSDKTNQSALWVHYARTVVVAHALLPDVWRNFVASWPPAGQMEPLFLSAGGIRLAKASVATIIRESFPGAGVSPHSLRVGCATELAASGIPTLLIMTIGRWSSLAALHYVIPVADAMAAATRSMGDGGVTLDRVVLQKALGGDVVPPSVRLV